MHVRQKGPFSTTAKIKITIKLGHDLSIAPKLVPGIFACGNTASYLVPQKRQEENSVVSCCLQRTQRLVFILMVSVYLKEIRILVKLVDSDWILSAAHRLHAYTRPGLLATTVCLSFLNNAARVNNKPGARPI